MGIKQVTPEEAQRLIAAGFGENRPIDPGNTPAAWQKNRRIEIRFTSP